LVKRSVWRDARTWALLFLWLMPLWWIAIERLCRAMGWE
jgi:hypothetical protein